MFWDVMFFQTTQHHAWRQYSTGDFIFVLTYGNKTVIWSLLLILATSTSALNNFSEITQWSRSWRCAQEMVSLCIIIKDNHITYYFIFLFSHNMPISFVWYRSIKIWRFTLSYWLSIKSRNRLNYTNSSNFKMLWNKISFIISHLQCRNHI